MALKATIYKAVVNVADLDRNRFLDAALTLARHPSETQERMMLRLLAWIKYADERLQFTRGLSAEDEPEAGCATIIWVSISGLSWGCRMSAVLRKPVLRRAMSRSLLITPGRRKSGGSSIKASARSSLTCPSGIWMTDNWRSSVNLPIVP